MKVKDHKLDQMMKGSPPPIEFQVTLENWRKYPYTTWSFVNVRNLIPTAQIETNISNRINFQIDLTSFENLNIKHEDNFYKFYDVLKNCNADAFLVMHKGKLIFEYFDNFTSKNTPHIIFSVSKSLTSLLAATLFKNMSIDVNKTVSSIIPETKDTAYEDATIRNVLDMNVASGFIEDYSGEAEIFKKYRSCTGWDLPEESLQNIPVGLHDFLSKMPRSKFQHGKKYHYCSPNSDLLGWITERVSGEKFYNIMSDLLFKPAGAIYLSNVTLDKWGASRSAGGISVSPYDLLSIAELVRCDGSNSNGQVIPSDWINDFKSYDDNSCYLNQDDLKRFPNGNYRSKWYQTGFDENEFCAIGIHGQNIWINPKKELTIIRMSSASDPINIQTEELMFSVFKTIAENL